MSLPSQPKNPPLPPPCAIADTQRPAALPQVPPLTRAQLDAMQANVRRLRELRDAPRPAGDAKPPG
ncbi:hypothetical protein [Acidovorax sp. SDU_ACID1]|uniref:hypothetical protein n=1 Tax=Acidovorax sp. SDU_ACID1 TaxID=3136632 RepID=UPI0038737E20